MDALEWKRAIVELVQIKARIDDADPKHLFDYRLPAVAASDESLTLVERHLGEPLDAEYRAFLSCAGGWRSFYQAVDLFGPDDLLGKTAASHRANELVSLLNVEGTLALAAVQREHVTPIAVSEHDMDVFLLCGRSSRTPGHVLWYAATPIEVFAGFDDYFLSMIALHRRRLKRLQGGACF